MFTRMTDQQMTDQQLQRTVVQALVHEPTFLPGEIAVSVHNGAVTLSGYVSTYSEKCKALDVAFRAEGVNAVADEVRVRLPATFGPTDGDMADALLHAVIGELHLPAGAISITVQNGWVTLTGRVAHRDQCVAVEHAARVLVGVTGVSNLIQASPLVAPKTHV